MARLIPNENTIVEFALTEDGARVDLTDFVLTVDASTTGNTLPTPTFASLFETSISGTVTATFTAEFYLDDENNLAWETLPRATNGYFFIQRFGAGGPQEKWPVRITTRSAMALTNNEVQRFGIEAAIPEEPDEDFTPAV